MAIKSPDIWKPSLLSTVQDFDANILDAVFVPNHEAIITSADNLTLNIFQKRESKYWSSKVTRIPSNAHILAIGPCPHQINRIVLYVGQQNGTISFYNLTEDTNSMEHVADILAHFDKITGLAIDLTNELIITSSLDKKLTVHCLKTRRLILSHSLDDPTTAMVYDATVSYCFIGDSQGTIQILNLKVDGAHKLEVSVINALHGHSAAITDLSWHVNNSILASASDDKSVIIWDIGGCKGEAFDLHYHKQTATTVSWWLLGPSTLLKHHTSKGSREHVLLSASLDGNIIFWIHNETRKESAKWQESNVCQCCGAAFIWNVRGIFEAMSMPQRQHHCRKCGKAVCQKCSLNSSPLPSMGYEQSVRVCNPCFESLTDSDKSSMAMILPSTDHIAKLRVDETKHRLLVVTKNNKVKILSLL